MIKLTKDLVRLYSAKDIRKRISDMGKEISDRYRDKNPIFIGVLNGSFIFLADLIREINLDCEIDFIKVRSYNGKKSSGSIQLLQDISLEVKNRDVILVEDIIDTGLTIKYLRERLNGDKPKSIAIATLLQKPRIEKIDFPIDFIGFDIPHEFVVGYGLDYNQKMRHLNGIYYVPSGSDNQRQ